MPSKNLFDRATLINNLETEAIWDVVVIGGGATGLGTALDAASRGYKTVLFEQSDFAKGTSSRSTKLVHGGVRYLAQGDLKLVYSALRERNILARNAAHIVKKQSFVIPCYHNWEMWKYGLGLKLYDLLAGRFSLGRSRLLSKKNVLKVFPTINSRGLKGGIEYFDGQFDDSRLAINIAQTAVEHSATVLNYFKVVGLNKNSNGKISGLKVVDAETGKEYNIYARAVVNATGVFVDDIMHMDEPGLAKLVSPSRGVHLVVHKRFLGSKSALMIPKTSDGRVLFAVPWYDHVVIGTTDTPIAENALDPAVPWTELQFILENVRNYMPEAPQKQDILSVFAGLRPLAAVSKTGYTASKELSRDHKLIISNSGLVTITGGKWTTYRKMAEVTVDAARDTAGLDHVASSTEKILLHGSRVTGDDRFSIYGSDAEEIRQWIAREQGAGDLLVDGHAFTVAEVLWAIRKEMARTVEDVLARRLRLLFLDASAAVKAAPAVADLIGKELGLEEKRLKEQLDDFYHIASLYKLN